MDYGDTPLLEATSNALGDSATMLTQPGLGGHFTLPDLVDGLFVSLALATLTTVLGAVIGFRFGTLRGHEPVEPRGFERHQGGYVAVPRRSHHLMGAYLSRLLSG